MVEQTSSKQAAKNGNTPPAVEAPKADRFKKVVTDRPTYRVETCYTKPLVGYLLGVGRMPDAQVTPQQKAQGKTGEWHAFVILTTEPTLACETGSDTPTEVPAGMEVTLGESYQTSELRKYLRPDTMLEVSITTSGKTKKLKNGNNMRIFDIGCDYDHPVKRPMRYALQTASVPPAKQLAASSFTDESEIPF
jgi:hypothetical protein